MYEFYCRTPIESLRADGRAAGGERGERAREITSTPLDQHTLSGERIRGARTILSTFYTRIPLWRERSCLYPRETTIRGERECLHVSREQVPVEACTHVALKRGISLLASPSINTAQQPDPQPAAASSTDYYYRLHTQCLRA